MRSNTSCAINIRYDGFISFYEGDCIEQFLRLLVMTFTKKLRFCSAQKFTSAPLTDVYPKNVSFAEWLVLLLYIVVGRRGRGHPPWILKFSEKGYFFSFEWEKANFTTFGPPEKILQKSPMPPLEITLPTAMLPYQTCLVRSYEFGLFLVTRLIAKWCDLLHALSAFSKMFVVVPAQSFLCRAMAPTFSLSLIDCCASVFVSLPLAYPSSVKLSGKWSFTAHLSRQQRVSWSYCALDRNQSATECLVEITFFHFANLRLLVFLFEFSWIGVICLQTVWETWVSSMWIRW